MPLIEPAFKKGVVVPCPDPLDSTLPVEKYVLMRDTTCCSHIRINVPIGCDYRERVGRIREAQLYPLLLLDLPAKWSPVEYGEWAEEVSNRASHYELGNEPLGGPDAHYDPVELQSMILAASAAIRANQPGATIWIPGEVLDLNDGRVKDYHQRLRRLLPRTAYDGVAIHPYREPAPYWDCAHRDDYGTMLPREYEWCAFRAAVGWDVPLMVTEVGWRLGKGGVTELEQAWNLRGEIYFLEGAEKCEGVFVYAHVSDDQGFGLFTPEWKPREAAEGLFAGVRDF